MNRWKERSLGLLLCLVIATPAWLLGRLFPVIGGPVIGIVFGMLIGMVWKNRGKWNPGIQFCAKYILQAAVVLLGFGLNLNVVLQTGAESLPIILGTISTSLLIAYLLSKVMNIETNTATLVGVGSSICGGSAIAAAAPVMDARDDEVAQAISVIFFFNVIAALLFPQLGLLLGFDTHSGAAFGVFAGTAINDTSSVTAAASTWDSINALGSMTLDKAVTVKLTRTLAIIPITLGLAFLRFRREKKAGEAAGEPIVWSKVFPIFILYFLLASVITTTAGHFGVSAEVFAPVKTLSKFCIVMAMTAIGLNSNMVQLVKKGGKPILLGLSCWIGITAVSLLLQHVLGIW